MIELTLAEVAAAVGGVLADVPDPDAVVTGPVTVDSRRVAPGGLFVAVAGAHHDGHDFAATAVASGAVAVLAARPVGVPAVVVGDVVAGLGRLAGTVRRRLPGLHVVGITGSSGKTSTKDLLAQLLERLGPTVAPPGNYNNEIGLPLTVLAADPTTRFLVLEMGARGLGHIRELTDIAVPDVGVVLNVGTAHVGEFGSQESIAVAKGELVEALPERGLAVLNADDPLVRPMAGRTAARVVRYGESDGADVRAVDVALDERGRPRFELISAAGRAVVAMRLVGEHQVSNALAAAAVALDAGAPLDVVAEALTEAEPRSRWRMEVVERPDGVTVVNDAYNANPESMRAALKALVALAGDRRSWAVLGEMGELGAEHIAAHDTIGRLAVRLNVDKLIVVGAGAKAMHLGAGMEGSWDDESVFVTDVEAAVALLREQLRPGDVVLVKASRAAGLERVAAALLADREDGAA
ncbi:MAG TPA: UDP-N-acetylmuramoyl-tripeptide--D-alanyl-D-alanine ligase [Actinomycetes bacterium]